jgi:hypothetical protein
LVRVSRDDEVDLGVEDQGCQGRTERGVLADQSIASDRRSARK